MEHGNKNHTFVGNSISLADVQFFQALASFNVYHDDEFSEKIIVGYPALVAIRHNVATQPQIQKWIAERPVTFFLKQEATVDWTGGKTHMKGIKFIPVFVVVLSSFFRFALQLSRRM